MVNLSLEHGNSDGSCFAYVFLGMIAGPHFDNYEAGFQFGRLGYELVEKRSLHRYQARTYMAFGSLVMPWTKHVRTGRDLVRRAFDVANKTGDLTFAAYSCNNLNTNLLAAGDPLAETQREAEQGLEFAHKAQFGLVIAIITAQLGLIRTLRGLTPAFGSFDDGSSMNAASNTTWRARRIWHWLSAGTGFGSCRLACWRAIIVRPSTHPQRLNRCFGHRLPFLRRRNMNSTAASVGQHSVIAHCRTSAAIISRLWPPTIASSRYGQRTVRKISRTAPHCLGQRSLAWKGENWMPNISTKRPSGQRMQTALSTMRHSQMNSLHDSTRRVVSKRSQTPICRTLGTAISVGEPMAK